jgi:UMF1 family MFS transporter
LVAWCLYDWANSAFPTVVVTFVFAVYYTTALAETPEAGAWQWGVALGLSGLVVALFAPILGALADQAGRRKPWIGAFTVLAVLSAAGLWWVEPDPAFALLALLLVGLGNAAFEFGQVFYNAMLPDVTEEARLGRVSGWAWGLGYAGGLACLALALVLFVRAEAPVFDLDRQAFEQVRVIGPFVAGWFALFALPLFFFTPDGAASGVPAGRAIRQGLGTLLATLRALPRHGQIGRFLLARMIYTDGLNTLFAFGGIYAADTFQMSFEEILEFGILLNVAAGLGAAGFGWMDDRLGAKPTIMAALIGLTLFGALILLVTSKTWFIVLGCAIGVFMGPAQAASRSLMARLAPAEVRTELFGLYALSGKATAWIGLPIATGVTALTESHRAGMATILAFFLVGLVLLWPLKDPRGRGNAAP